MLVLITGGSGSGKSAYAEEYTVGISGEKKKYYLATMQVFDEEGQRRIERHRKQRSGKGFVTIEQQTSICAALEKMDDFRENPAEERTALLECLSNLIANEMFSGGMPGSFMAVADKAVREIEMLNRGLEHLVIVTNNVFEDGIIYDETTMEYLKALGSVNERLAIMADRVVEVVVGIPVIVKEET